MSKPNYRIVSNALFEIASTRLFTEKDNLAERFNENGEILLVKDRNHANLTLSIVKREEDVINYLVKWDDSEEFFTGWNMAWEEFQWCLGIVTAEAEKARAEEEAAQAALAAEQGEESEEEAEESEEATEETVVAEDNSELK